MTEIRKEKKKRILPSHHHNVILVKLQVWFPIKKKKINK